MVTLSLEATMVGWDLVSTKISDELVEVACSPLLLMSTARPKKGCAIFMLYVLLASLVEMAVDVAPLREPDVM